MLAVFEFWGWRAYPGHEDHAVNAHLPFLGKHLFCFAPEGSGVGGDSACFFGFDELLRFGEEYADDADAEGDASWGWWLGMFMKKLLGGM